jgi:hypothetical protein
MRVREISNSREREGIPRFGVHPIAPPPVFVPPDRADHVTPTPINRETRRLSYRERLVGELIVAKFVDFSKKNVVQSPGVNAFTLECNGSPAGVRSKIRPIIDKNLLFH